MYFSSSFYTISLLICISSLSALNTTTTTKAVIIPCHQDSQCPSNTHFCNTKQNVCIHKHSLNAACQHDNECLNSKCHDQLCQRTCKENENCSQTKEYCSITNYCTAKHCGICFRDVHCANHQCHFFYCSTTNCASMLNSQQNYS